MVAVWTLLTFAGIARTSALTGHVCSRQVAETYLTTYDRAYVCPERYTTACGQLDWRRCTKYRVNTCYTPTERYAVRYRTEEGCCPGWRNGGDGVCGIPNCGDGCQNGGTCSDIGGAVSCVCSKGYNGHMCEHSLPWLDGWRVALLVTAAVIAAVILTLVLKHLRKSRTTSFGASRPTAEEGAKLLQPDPEPDPGHATGAQTAEAHSAHQDTPLTPAHSIEPARPTPSAPLRDFT